LPAFGIDHHERVALGSAGGSTKASGGETFSPMQFGFFGLLPAFFFWSIVPSLKADEVSENTFAPVEGVPLIIAQPPRLSAAMPPARRRAWIL